MERLISRCTNIDTLQIQPLLEKYTDTFISTYFVLSIGFTLLYKTTFPAIHESINCSQSAFEVYGSDDDKVNVPVKRNNLCSNCWSSERSWGAQVREIAEQYWDGKVGLFLLGIMKIIPAYSNGDGEAHFYARSLHMYRTIQACLFMERAREDRLGNSAWWIKYLAAL